MNARSLEGMKSEYGTIRPDRLIRSGNLHDISDSDVEQLKNAGLKVVIDLRSPSEHDANPDREMEGVEIIHLPIFDDTMAGVVHEKDTIIRVSKMPEMKGYYHNLVGQAVIPVWQKIFAIFDEHRNETIGWHCSAGKDRCGITAYMIEYILGVDEQTRMNDYIQSNDTFAPRAEMFRQQALARGMSEEVAAHIKSLTMVNEEYMLEAMKYISENYGTIDAFLLECGVDEQYKQRLREAFLE